MSNQLMKNMDNKDKQKLVKKWESSGLLDNIKGELSKIDIVNLLESNATQFCKIELEQLDLLIQQAKAMEKDQIIDIFGVGCQVESTRLIGYHGMAEQYYNETFKSEEDDNIQ